MHQLQEAQESLDSQFLVLVDLIKLGCGEMLELCGDPILMVERLDQCGDPTVWVPADFGALW